MGQIEERLPTTSKVCTDGLGSRKRPNRENSHCIAGARSLSGCDNRLRSFPKVLLGISARRLFVTADRAQIIPV